MYRNEKYFENSPTVLLKWCNEPGWPIEYVSGNVARVFGYSKKDFVNQSVRYDHIIHPYDLARVADEVMYAGSTLRDEVTHIPYRIITQSGEILWVENTTKIERSKDGTIIAYHGSFTDITEQINMNVNA
jgi:PAS domain S-box-containing protein